jgi:Protein of unknown function (DUF4232)
MTIRRGVAAIVVAAATLACVAGCQQGTASGSPAAAPEASGTPSTGSTSTEGTGTGSASVGASANSATSVPPASGAAGAPGTPPCSLGDLAVAISGAQGPASGQRTVSITFTSQAHETCYLYGFPGVDLVAKSLTWPLQRSGPSPERVVLQPRGVAYSTLTFLAWVPGDSASFTPTEVEVTPPGDTEHATLPWKSGDPILLQNEATRPGTYIGPVSRG